jgi:hypothetical protein
VDSTYLGLASLVIIAISIHLWIRALRRVEIPENRGGFAAAWVIAAGLGLAALAGEPGWLGGISAGIAAFASSFLLLTLAIGGQKVASDAIQVGATIPPFTATDEFGETFDSESLAGHPVLIKFFRAHW